MPTDVSPEQKEYALVVLNEYYRGDLVKAAGYLKISVATLKRWQRDVAFSTPQPLVLTGRPQPPMEICDEEAEEALFLPAPELAEWVRNTFLNTANPLYNAEHDHLIDAHIGFLWTNVAYRRQGRDVAGMAEMPSAQGHLWLKTRMEQQLRQWFDLLPNFLITLYAPRVSRIPDPTFCALLEHEMYHCGQKQDAFGGPAFSKFTGEPLYTMRGHDVEEFIGVVRRYGVGAASAGVARLVQAAERVPEIAEADIAMACGVCGRAVG